MKILKTDHIQWVASSFSTVRWCADKGEAWDHPYRRKRKASGWYFWTDSPALGFLSLCFQSLVTFNDPHSICLIKSWLPNLSVRQSVLVGPGSLSPSPLIPLPSSPCLPCSFLLLLSHSLDFSGSRQRTSHCVSAVTTNGSPLLTTQCQSGLLWLQGLFYYLSLPVLASHVQAHVHPL